MKNLHRTPLRAPSAIITILAALLLGLAGCSSDSNTDSPETVTSDVAKGKNFVTFESGQVRPLALSPDGNRLFATNTPNSTLEIYVTDAVGLTHEFTVPVGMEPVALAVRGSEVWVVNHLSDSISIVDVSVNPPTVVNTLLVGDEPRDIVFAGDNQSLAFVTTAHRGQNGADDNAIDAQLFSPGTGRADVWVFDADNKGSTLGGDPVNVVSLFGDSPRALSVSPDNQTVYVAVMHSGNKTTTVGEKYIAKPGPTQSSDGIQQPDTGLIVQHDGSDWKDGTGRLVDLAMNPYNDRVSYSLPDYDVFAIDATISPTIVSQYSGVGTTLFNMITHPTTGTVFVSNTEALNVNRFEGSGESVDEQTVRGNFIRNRISILDGGSVKIRDLNEHLDHEQDTATIEEKRLSISQPLGMAFSADGESLYVAGFGSSKIAVYDTRALIDDTFSVTTAQQIQLDAGGPTGVILHAERDRLYVLTRFDNGIAIVDTNSHTSVGSVSMYNPEPDSVIAGRPFLYEAAEFSSHGDVSCASCHIFGDLDGLAWDLGNPDGEVVANPNQFLPFLAPDRAAVFHPLKGPMTTQSLRGLANNGPMHWRGDRTGVASSEIEGVEIAAFKDFNPAFQELLGSAEQLSTAQMSQFAEFALQIVYPPNPIRALDNSLTPSQAAGLDIYMNEQTTGDIFTCNDCHVLDPNQGHFGTDGRSSVEGDDISQEFKVPHLRNLYQKVGKFGNSGRFSADDTEFGEQIKGFGFMHDGHMDTLDNFFQGSVFHFADDEAVDEQMRGQVIDLVMAMDSDLAPIVGQQITLSASSDMDTQARVDLLVERAAVMAPKPECDLIVKGVVNGQPRGYFLQESGEFQSDKSGELETLSSLRNIAQTAGQSLTFTCVPPGAGLWMGIDRNEDGLLDNDVN